MYSGIEIHDIAYYLVETEMGISSAFYGKLAKGYSIQVFQPPREKRPTSISPDNLAEQATQTEHLVNLLQIFISKYISGNLLKTLQVIFQEKQILFPEKLDK